jgi:hypothetical protein
LNKPGAIKYKPRAIGIDEDEDGEDASNRVAAAVAMKEPELP